MQLSFCPSEIPLRKQKTLWRFGRTQAHETKNRDLVPAEVVERTPPILWATVAAMVQVQRFAGMRPSEVCKMQVGDIDRSDDIWLYRPGSHKGTWRNQDKVIPLGKAEQRIIDPRLAGKGPENAVFSPKETIEEKRASDAARRQTSITPSQRKRQEDRANNSRSRAREFYDSGSYGRSIKRSIEKFNEELPDGEKIPHWTPYQLRHTAVTETSLSDGIEAASALAGHRSLNVTKIYDHSMLEKAKELARKRK